MMKVLMQLSRSRTIKNPPTAVRGIVFFMVGQVPLSQKKCITFVSVRLESCAPVLA